MDTEDTLHRDMTLDSLEVLKILWKIKGRLLSRTLSREQEVPLYQLWRTSCCASTTAGFNYRSVPRWTEQWLESFIRISPSRLSTSRKWADCREKFKLLVWCKRKKKKNCCWALCIRNIFSYVCVCACVCVCPITEKIRKIRCAEKKLMLKPYYSNQQGRVGDNFPNEWFA